MEIRYFFLKQKKTKKKEKNQLLKSSILIPSWTFKYQELYFFLKSLKQVTIDILISEVNSENDFESILRKDLRERIA